MKHTPTLIACAFVFSLLLAMPGLFLYSGLSWILGNNPSPADDFFRSACSAFIGIVAGGLIVREDRS